MLETKDERRLEARHLAQDLALRGLDAEDIFEGLFDAGLHREISDDEIDGIIREVAVADRFKSGHGPILNPVFRAFGGVVGVWNLVLRIFGAVVLVGGGVVWYFFGFDMVPLIAIIVGLLLFLAPGRAFSDIFED